VGFKNKASGGSSGAQSTYLLQVGQVSGGSRACVIEIAGSHTLEQLHQTIHDAVGPPGLQSWEFQAGGRSLHDNRNRRYGPSDLANDDLDDAAETTVDDLKLKAGQVFGYISTAGSAWEFSIEIQAVQKSSRGFEDPRVVGITGDVPPPAPRSAPPKQAPTRPPVETPGRNAQAAASSYILIALLQRLERTHPGLTRDLLAGVEADRSALPAATADREFVEAIFDEAIKTLRQAAATQEG
jgi:hypothetical protein